MTAPATKLALFCKVVDNFGDIGICWRLARQLQREHGIAVTLWVDDLHSFRRICPHIIVDAQTQELFGVRVRHWRDQEDEFAAADIADIVIEFFGCDIPPGYTAAMAKCEPRPVWLNLEGLTAEEWVEGCHTLPSSHPRLPLTKHFFFPGFTVKTGGLLVESELPEQRAQFQEDASAAAAFLAQFRLTPAEMAAFKVSLFCYPHAPVSELFEVWREGRDAVTCLVPEGVAVPAVRHFLECEPLAGVARMRGALTVRVLPFVAQPDYDKLLWSCDLNVVRGEDSFVRAQWACRPFIWHIYPQDENLHHKKLRAFLQRYAPDLPALDAFSLQWNGAAPERGQDDLDWPALWQRLNGERVAQLARANDWQRQVLGNGDLAANLLKFSASVRARAGSS